MKKSIFITGASSGIGKGTAKFFHEKGWNVIATMRKPEKENELDQLENVHLLPLDVTDLDQIDKTVQEAIDLHPIDVVLNNAGYGTMGPLEGTTDQEIQDIINTNLLGVIRLTKAFLPHLREKGSGTIINVTSIGGLVAYPFFSLYHASKWAVEGWAESMDFELRKFGIQIKTIQPGPTRTDFGGRSLVNPSHEAYDESVKEFWAHFTAEGVEEDFEDAIEVSRIIYEAATDGKRQLRYTVGKIANNDLNHRHEIGAQAWHEEVNRAFF